MLVLLPLLSLAAAPVAVADVVNPRAHHDGWVSDMAQVLPDDQEAALEGQLAALHRDLGVEIAVVTVGDVDAPTPRDFSTELFNAWGIGDVDANNGFLVLLVLDQRRIEMETGYGLEGVLTDGWLGRVRTERMVPAFKAGDYGTGLVRGVRAIDERLRANPTEARLGTEGRIPVADGAERRSAEDASGLHGVAWTAAKIGGGAGLLGLGGLGVVLYRRRRRRCPTCKVQMRKLCETEEDDHLTAGQQTEESVSAVQWSVYQCETCSFVRTFDSRRWISGYAHCPECLYRTRSSSSTTLKSPRVGASGLARVDEECAHCSYRSSYTRILPALSESSSSSSGGGYSGGSSGGSSFGGGSSGGGGGGSSW